MQGAKNQVVPFLNENLKVKIAIKIASNFLGEFLKWKLVSAQVWEYKRIVMLEMQFETLTFFVSSLTYF